jgi:hypothetical protein
MEYQSNYEEQQNKLPFSVAFTLFLGLGIISLLFATIAIAIIVFIKTPVSIGYFVIAFLAIINGFYLNHVTKKINIKNNQKVLLGILSPALALIFIIGTLITTNTLN